MVREAKDKGIKEKRVCELLRISTRRIREWKGRESLEDGRPGPVSAPHALLPAEREEMINMAKDEAYMDDSHRVLAAKATDAGKIHASASSFYREMRERGLMGDRGGRRHRNGNSQAPEREDLTGPNQRWAWDISYLTTAVKGMFLYLYLLLDEFSRKAIAWRVSWSLSHKEGMELIQQGIEKEGLEPEQIKNLSLYNDRGVQMKAKNFMAMLQNLGIQQRFSRPRTPNDNPFVESMFSTTKGAAEYPGRFTDVAPSLEYFDRFFDRYNTERLHGGIGYVTPEQKHQGLARLILLNRKTNRKEARERRLQLNRQFRENSRNELPAKVEQAICVA